LQPTATHTLNYSDMSLVVALKMHTLAIMNSVTLFRHLMLQKLYENFCLADIYTFHCVCYISPRDHQKQIKVSNNGDNRQSNN